MNEENLEGADEVWRPLLDCYNCATTERFENTECSALDIIASHLRHLFVPGVTEDMVVKNLPFDQTKAGNAATRDVEKQFRERLRRAPPHEVEELQKRQEATKREPRQKFDKEKTEKFEVKMKKLKRKQIAKRSLRWTVRTVSIGAASTITVFTGGVGAGQVRSLLQRWQRYGRKLIL